GSQLRADHSQEWHRCRSPAQSFPADQRPQESGGLHGGRDPRRLGDAQSRRHAGGAMMPHAAAAGSLTSLAFDPELTPGASNAVRVCLRIQPSEKVTLITDQATREIAASLARQIESVGARQQAFILEDLASRPLVALPAEILGDMESSQVSIFAAQVQTNELKSRMQMTEVVTRRQMRHAHMVNINRQIMLEGMRADYQKVDRISTRVLELVSV